MVVSRLRCARREGGGGSRTSVTETETKVARNSTCLRKPIIKLYEQHSGCLKLECATYVLCVCYVRTVCGVLADYGSNATYLRICVVVKIKQKQML